MQTLYLFLMTKEVKKKRPWIQNLLNPYRMVIINETTFEEKFIRISQLYITLLVLLFVTFIIVGSFFWWHTHHLRIYSRLYKLIDQKRGH